MKVLSVSSTPSSLEQHYDRNRAIGLIVKVEHGNLGTYVPDCRATIAFDPEFYAHLIAWTYLKSESRDTKIALATIGLRSEYFADNAVAHLMTLGPRELVRALQFNQTLTKSGYIIGFRGTGNILEQAVRTYLAVREANRNWWNSAVLSDRSAMRNLYKWYHVKTPSWVQDILFNNIYPANSVFAKVTQLKDMSPKEAAGTILRYKIPFPVAIGAVAKATDPDILLALIEQMSGNELFNSTGMLTKLGVMTNPTLRSAYDAAIERAKQDKRTSSMKAAVAAKATSDKVAAAKILQVQDSRLAAKGGIEGSWLVLGDRSGSMHLSVELAKHVAALIASQVSGKVWLVFFDASPQAYDVTGKTLDQIQAETQYIKASGYTSIGCGLDWLQQRGEVASGIAIVSDGGENRAPWFWDTYKKYTSQTGIEPPVYLFHTMGERNVLAEHAISAGYAMEEFDYTSGIDYYGLPTTIALLHTNRYALADEIMATPLLTLEQVFSKSHS